MHSRCCRLPVPVRAVLHVSEVPLHGGLARLLTLFGMDAANEYQCRIYIMLLSMHIQINRKIDRDRDIRLNQIRLDLDRQTDRQIDGWMDRQMGFIHIPNKLGMYIHIYITVYIYITTICVYIYAHMPILIVRRCMHITINQ